MLRLTWWLVACLAAGVAGLGNVGCRSSGAGLQLDPVRAGGASGAGGSGGRAGSGGSRSGGNVGSMGGAGGNTGVEPIGGRADAGTDGGDGPPVVVTDALAEQPRETAPPVDQRQDMTTPPPDAAPAYWKPTLTSTWDWQSVEPVRTDVNAQVFSVDLFDNDTAVVADLHGRMRKVVCHVDLGTWKRGDTDSDRFPTNSIGSPYKGNSDRRWIDVTNITGLLGMIRGRLDQAQIKGCDAVVPENLDAWDTRAHEPSGFMLTAIDQILYNRTVAAEAHKRGMSVGLKGDVRQVSDLVGDFDFHVSENCYMRRDCNLLSPFVMANKPVFNVEFTLMTNQFCAQAKTDKIVAIRKRPALDNFRETCPP
ncbi:MAG TPA: endo alpha-1,4 polygalactosaminidase [Polyangia bacterium]